MELQTPAAGIAAALGMSATIPAPTKSQELENLDAARTIAAEYVANMPALTEAESTLVEHYMKTGNKSEAYRLTYPDRAERWQSQSINVEASKAFAKTKIQQTLKALTLAGLFGAPTNLENHIGELRHIKHRAIDAGELGTARLCEKNIGEVSRLYVSEVVVEHVKPSRPEEMVKRLAPGNPKGQAEILEAIKAARAKPVALDVEEIAGAEAA